MSERQSPGVSHTAPKSQWAKLLPSLAALIIFVAVLFLPPISLGKRLSPDSFTAIGGRVWSVTDPDGAELTVLPVGLPDDVDLALELTSIPRVDFLDGAAGEAYQPMAEALPPHLTLKSPLYQIRVQGATPTAAILRIPIPNDAEPWYTLDVYGWSADRWYWLEGRLRQAKEDIQVRLDSLPEAVAVMQTQATALVWSAPLPADRLLFEEQPDTLAEIYPEGAFIAEDGRILADPSLSLLTAPADVRVMPTVRNWVDASNVWQGRVDRIVNDAKLRQAHVNALRQFVAQGGYDGVDIDYRGLAPESRDAFSQFVADLAQALHQDGKLVSVRVSQPMAITSNQWDAGPYDWPAISRAADVLRVPLPPAPRAYQPDGQASAFLDWAVGRADRYKLQAVFVPLAVEQAGNGLTTLSYTEALALLARLETAGVPQTIVSGDGISLQLPLLRRSSGLLYDQTLHTWWFTYLDAHHYERTVWLNNAEGLTLRAALAASYHLRGIAVEGLTDPGSDPNLWAATVALSSASEPPVAERFSLRWQTDGPEGQRVEETPLAAENAAHTWTAPSTTGAYNIAVTVAQDDQPVAASEPLPVQVVSAIAMITPTPSPLPTSAPPGASPTPTPPLTGAPPAATATPTPPPASVSPTAAPTSTPPPAGSPPAATATPTATPTGVLPTATPTSAAAPTPTSPPASTPTPSLLPGPLLLEPEIGASFLTETRLKWGWLRRLESHEKFAVRWEPASGQETEDWWVNEDGILGGGGAIILVEGRGYVFEVNFGLDSYPGGEAYWSVAIFGETESNKWQISDWSERWLIYHGAPPD